MSCCTSHTVNVKRAKRNKERKCEINFHEVSSCKMSWYQNILPEGIKKNVCAYLLQRYLGRFFEEKLTRDQLNIDLYNGTGTLENISLDVEALNELGEKQNWPLEFVDGYIDKLFVTVPFMSILKDSSYVEVRGLKITVQPKQRHESATSMFESMWNSMTSSMQLAEECAKQDGVNASNSSDPYEGIKIFAQTIDSILSRVKVKFVDTVFQVEHVPKLSCTGVGIVINIDLIDYSDEAGNDPSSDETDPESKKAFVVHSFTTRNLTVTGVTLSTVEFSSKARTFSRSVLVHSQQETEHDSLVTVIENSPIADDSRKSTPEEPESLDDLNGHRYVIKFGQISGTQEIRVKLKQSENVVGPKVSIDVTLGSFIIFLSPRQFHLLLQLADGLSKPDTVDNSNVAPRTHCANKPMTVLDYQRVEQELQNQIQSLSNFQIAGLQAAQGWSSPNLDDSGAEETFLPLKNAVSGLYDSSLSGISSSLESSVTSSMVSSMTDHSQKSRRKISSVDADPSAEISHFQIRVASLAAVLLLEDVLFQPVDKTRILATSGVQKMQQIVGDFFGKLGHFAHGCRDFRDTRETFDEACSRNHLKLLAAPIQIEGDEKTTCSAFSVTSQLSAAKMEVYECWYNSTDNVTESVPLLAFAENPSAQNMMGAKPSLKVTFKHVERTKNSNRRNSGVKSEVTLFLNKLDVELDITIIDRINALLESPAICVPESTPYNPWGTDNLSNNVSPMGPIESKMDLKVICPLVNVKLRFPVPDFRPAHDMNRTPWWKRHVRSDYLSLLFADFLLQYAFHTHQSSQEYSIQSRALEVFYHENETGPALPIAKTEVDDGEPTSMQDVMSQIRLNIKLYPKQINELEKMETEANVMTTSFYGAFENQNKDELGPFSAKRVVHESDTPHSKPQNDDTAELIIPGDKYEIEDFIRSTTEFVKIHVQVFLPTLSVQLKSKHIYELIYNRINNDLLLWSPSAPKLNSTVNAANYSTYGGKNLFVDGPDTFTMCKSGIQYASDSDSDESEASTSNVFFSTYDHKTKLNQKSQAKVQETVKLEQSEFVLSIQISRGVLCMNPPVRDSGNNVIPGQQGEFALNLNDANVFIVSGYKGDTNLGFVCVQLHNAQLYHCDMMSIPTQDAPLRQIGRHMPPHLSPTIYKSEPGMLVTSKNRGGNREMLTVAVRIQASHETHHVKTVRVALGLNRSTLKHRMCTEPNSWISHLLDFFNVQDYPITNYHAKDVLTELHLHVWDCAVDYRPLNLPIRSAITIGNFSMSSHLSAQSNTSTLRFIFEECAMFLSEKAPPKNGKASLAPVDLVKDYVNVLELGLFELSLRTTDKRSGRNPHIDLRASNNMLNIHTCADSGRMLMQLLVYFANDGDLSPPPSSDKTSRYSSPRHQVEQELVHVEPQISNLSKSQHEHVNTLIGEAMKENEVAEHDTLVASNPGAKLFYFPDEKQLQRDEFRPPLQVTYELGDVAAHRSSRGSDTDDEFCIVADEPGLGLYPADGVPEIRWLSSDPVRIVDNHFGLPAGKADALKAPKSFPTPVARYTLCDMTVAWHMYGGNDFKLVDGESGKKNVQFSETQLNTTVTFSKGNNNRNEVNITTNLDKKKANMNWILKGGVNRDHDVHMELHLNKVRFQHEVYPETTKQASRQVLIISDVEIVDRLESSQFNKFLYQYTSQTRPKQSHAHMIVIKALHIRPDIKLPTQECCLKISLLPLRLNIDQDSLLFLISFFTEIGGDNTAKNDDKGNVSKHNTPTHQPPVMTVNEENEQVTKKQALKVVDENLIMLMEESKCQFESDNSSSNPTSTTHDESPVFFKNLIFGPDVLIRLDYHGKRVDMTHGSLSGLLMGLGQLNCSELRLKRVSYRHGLLGFDKLIKYLVAEWLNDIKRNQLPSLLGGVGPMHTLVQLFQGVRDLFWLPIEQYQKDGRIVRGLQRGANSFTTSTAMAALELTSRIIHLIQITAETAYDMLSPGPSVRMLARAKGKRKRYHQPQDIREGMTNAILLVKEGIGETADTIVQVATLEKEQKGYSGAVGGVLRQIPPTMLKPIIIASEATSNVLGGMRSQLVPDARREANQKWRKNDDVNCDKN
ncbi:unnamed protein product [Phyllotreta striolata]|uniref:Autophagy-related protein 2 n=1 Tax=Phyllotreta striolata TaxID=444603 RepID=A0A9N9XVN4_PHYSR|nr:unnamed protein product [Phyllotreta striolata]